MVIVSSYMNTLINWERKIKLSMHRKNNYLAIPSGAHNNMCFSNGRIHPKKKSLKFHNFGPDPQPPPHPKSCETSFFYYMTRKPLGAK